MTKEERQAKYNELADCLSKASGIMQELKDYVLSAAINLNPIQNIYKVPNDKQVIVLLAPVEEDFPFMEKHEIDSEHFTELHTKAVGDCLFYTFGGSKDGQ